MKRNMMRRNLSRSIRRSLGRYIAIVAIIALGAGIFVGLRTTKSDMIATGQRYMDEQNMFDLRLLSTYGWEREDVTAVAQMAGIEDAEGVISMDVIASFGEGETDSVYKLYPIPERINRVYLHGGRMPQSPNECLADGFHATDEILGKTVTIAASNDQETKDSLTNHTFTVVGYVSTPLYMDMSRGNTSLGNGTISGFLYLPEDAFDLDYYTEIAVTLPGKSVIYTDDYHDFVDSKGESLNPLLLDVAQARYLRLLAEAQDQYADGLKAYEEGLASYQQAKAEANSQLAQAEKQLMDGERELKENREKLEQAMAQIEDGQAQIDSGRMDLSQGRLALSQSKAETFAQIAQASAELMENYNQVTVGLAQIKDGIEQIDSGIIQLDSGITQLESGLGQLSSMVTITETLLDLANSSLERAEAALQAAMESGVDSQVLAELQQTVADARTKMTEYQTQLSQMKEQQQAYSEQLADLKAQKEELSAQRAKLVDAQKPLEDALNQINLGFSELESSQTQAKNSFAAAESELDAAQIQLDLSQAELDKGRKELEAALVQLDEGRSELEEGWSVYRSNAAQAEQEFSDGWLELQDAKAKLQEAKDQLDSMAEPDVYALGRNSNMGYLALDNNSDIVEGVSTVFPAFFLLIAALVCITTMTRMVEEERTQIGTLKALGYGNGRIIGKYLAYAGTAAVFGCGLGVFAGSVAFPLILWEAYQIIMFLGDYFCLGINWALCLLVVGVYTAVTLLVTWYCCRRSLREAPAELIRPKPPTLGKAIFMEKLPFWNRFSFLNKVMLRNIFRYRQRLLMMLVGIGGCTALLLTGFGIRDTVGNIADHQFDEIILYDLEIRFDHHMTTEDQQAFLDDLDGQVRDSLFYHQSSMELSYDDQVSDVNFIAADRGLERFIDLHNGKKTIPMPGLNEALISVGVAERFGIDVGDLVTVRDSDMNTLELTVSGLFNNNVHNYVIITPETMERQWERLPQVQMACIYAAEGSDVHKVGAYAAKADSAMNVTVNQDVREQVGRMLEALDLVVVTVVICAALLAIIVLYNLTNINITERIREIATIKVLGFRAGETAAYVFKENLLLSVMGAVIGLGGGILLLEFVISKIQVDMVWFSARLSPLSYLWAVVITLLSACSVDLILYFRLEKINMAEALKSVE